jgi:hypothetical protein
VALGAVAGWQRLGWRLRVALVALGLLALVGLMIVLSWPALLANPRHFMLIYFQVALDSQAPTYIDGFYSSLLPHIGRIGAAPIGIALVLFGTLGPWLPGFLLLGFWAWRRGRLELCDALPVLLVVVAVLEMLLAPVARNGDFSEYRHRGGGLLVVVFAVWTLRFALLLAAPLLARPPAALLRLAVAGIAALSLLVLGAGIAAAKRPRFTWGQALYGTRVAPELAAIAPLLREGGQARPRFVVANQPADTRLIDDAARLVALSGVPAYIACPALHLVTAGRIAQEAARRMDIVAQLAAAPDLAALRALMRSAGISHYVVTSPAAAAFDPERREAIGRVGSYAVYLATPAG